MTISIDCHIEVVNKLFRCVPLWTTRLSEEKLKFVTMSILCGLVDVLIGRDDVPWVLARRGITIDSQGSILRRTDPVSIFIEPYIAADGIQRISILILGFLGYSY